MYTTQTSYKLSWKTELKLHYILLSILVSMVSKVTVAMSLLEEAWISPLAGPARSEAYYLRECG